MDVAAGLPEVIVATGTSTSQYVQVGGQVLAQYDSGAWAYVLPDHLGSVRQLTNGAASVTLAKSYQPFGTGLSSTGTAASPFGFAGEQTDATGLQFLRARYYAPGQGRFLGQDPARLEPNLYLYATANPVNFIDPTGLIRWQAPRDQFHGAVEDWYMAPNQVDKQVEYPIPTPSSPNRNYWPRADMFNSRSGDVFEIEPIYLAFAPGHGQDQADRYVEALNGAAGRGALAEKRNGMTYNWNSTRFHRGQRQDWRGLFRQDIRLFSPLIRFQLVADYLDEGLIVYWLEPKVMPLPAPNGRLQEREESSYKRLIRPRNWDVQKERRAAASPYSFNLETLETFAKAAGPIVAGACVYLLWNLKGCIFGPAGCVLDLATPVP